MQGPHVGERVSWLRYWEKAGWLGNKRWWGTWWEGRLERRQEPCCGSPSGQGFRCVFISASGQSPWRACSRLRRDAIHRCALKQLLQVQCGAEHRQMYYKGGCCMADAGWIKEGKKSAEEDPSAQELCSSMEGSVIHQNGNNGRVWRVMVMSLFSDH